MTNRRSNKITACCAALPQSSLLWQFWPSLGQKNICVAEEKVCARTSANKNTVKKRKEMKRTPTIHKNFDYSCHVTTQSRTVTTHITLSISHYLCHTTSSHICTGIPSGVADLVSCPLSQRDIRKQHMLCQHAMKPTAAMNSNRRWQQKDKGTKWKDVRYCKKQKKK